MKKKDKKYRQGRNKGNQSQNETIAFFVFLSFGVLFVAFLIYKLLTFI